MTVIGGLFYDRYGPFFTGLVGSSLVVLGYMLLYMGAKVISAEHGTIQPIKQSSQASHLYMFVQGIIANQYAVMGVYALIMGQGSG
jgi:hypothetical protein